MYHDKETFPDDFKSCGREGDTFLRGFSWKVFQRKIEHSECYKKMEKIKNMGYIKIYTVCF